MKKSPATVISEKKYGKWCRFFLTSTLLMMWSCVALYAQTESSRQQKIIATYKNNTITEVLEDLKAKTGYTFVHKQNEIDGDIKITENFTGATLDDILESVLIRHGYDYSIESRVIVIRRQARQEQAEVKRKKVNGTVKDEHGELLPGVTVRIKNTTMGTATDSDGKYTLTFPDGEYTLVFSMVGMQDREELVGKRTEIDVVMQQVAAEIEEVVVTGIFKKAKESYTGAVSTIGKEEILAYRGQNMLQTLRNIDPAFNVVQNNEFGSDPNRLPDITVRGNSSLTTNLKELNEGTKNDLNVPLIIMDDFEISLT
ncbi:MAG: carboxypeptidase-like regulatory domain-containing protein, partial [Odoribacter sp.]|nr:carboxypeptidase-like regulatory domain-containing protein [Odoribacter sp.]